MLSVVLILGLQIGRMISYNGDKPSLFSHNAPNTFDEVINFIKAKYVDTVNVDELKNKAIENLLIQLDPHSSFIPASEMQQVDEVMSGKFEGIGIEYFILNDTVMALNIVSGGPSEKAGLKSGDRIIFVNDTLIAGVGITDQSIIKKLRGTAGTTVKVKVLRTGVKQLLSFTITREKIPLNSIDASYMIVPGTGYIKINRFSSTTYDEFVSAITTLKKAGMQKLIIDLRGNGGGYLESATDMVDELIDQQKVMVYTKGRVYPRKDYISRVLGHFEEGQLAILIDEGSASASEIVAGAIQDYDRGVIIGRRSFGKGFVESQLPLSDGSALRLTIAKYYTPSGRCIQKPYTHDINAYYQEINNRYTDGELTSADSMTIADTTKYFTTQGRVVYGGGGIVPDIFIPLDTSMVHDPYINTVLIKNLIPNFVYSYYSSHKKEIPDYKSVNELVNDLKWKNILTTEFINQNKSAINYSATTKSTEYISLQLQAYMAQQMFGVSGFYEVINTQDKTILAALHSFK